MNRLKKHLKSLEINKDDRVKWQYTHHLNSKSRVQRVKIGVFIKKIYRKSDYPKWRVDTCLYCFVHFDGNKNKSRVLFSELTKVLDT